MAKQNDVRPFGFSKTGLERVEFGFLLGDALTAINSKLDTAMASLGLTQSQWRALVQVFRLDRPTQSDLARAIGIGRASLGVLVDQLVQAGYLTREPDEKDRRIWRIVPTAYALRQSVAIRQLTEDAMDPLFANIDRRDLRTAKSVLIGLLQGAT